MSPSGSRLLLCVDVGNTHTVLGLWGASGWQRSWRIRTNPRATADEYAVSLAPLLEAEGSGAVGAVAICSVVPTATQTLVEWATRTLEAEAAVLGPDDAGVERIRYDDPWQLGMDRLANALAGYARTHAPTIVVDCGTATKFEFVDGDGSYHGGAIAPGVGIAADALFARAARLYRVPLVAPGRVIGRNTVHALQVGLLHGHAALIDGMVARIQSETGVTSRVIATGGFARLLVPLCWRVDEVVDFLTLDGVRLIFEQRQEKKKRRDRLNK